jgi:gas vesicle protein
MRERVMGTADDVKTSANDTVHSGVATTQHGAEQLAETARELPGQARDQVRTQTQGNPLAAGLIAFGGGLLTAYMFPTSQVERRAAGQVREAAEPAVRDLKETGRSVAEDLKDTAAQAADEVKQTASSSAQRIADDAKDAADDVRSHASSATETVGDRARQASDEVRH